MREDHIAMRPLVRKCDALTLIESCVLPPPLLLHGQAWVKRFRFSEIDEKWHV